MTQWHLKSRRKPSGGIRTAARRRDKRLALKGGDFASTSIAESGKDEKRLVVEGRGRTKKTKAKKVKFAYVFNPAKKRVEKAEIAAVQENKANRLYTRRNIITKNAIIKVDIGNEKMLARVTSRPGQHGTVQAVLIGEKAQTGEEKAEKPKKQNI